MLRSEGYKPWSFQYYCCHLNISNVPASTTLHGTEFQKCTALWENTSLLSNWPLILLLSPIWNSSIGESISTYTLKSLKSPNLWHCLFCPQMLPDTLSCAPDSSIYSSCVSTYPVRMKSPLIHLNWKKFIGLYSTETGPFSLGLSTPTQLAFWANPICPYPYKPFLSIYQHCLARQPSPPRS